ncbi:MAG: hypothetical protein JNK50_11035 [Bacteroidia bacterium]|nr:hypothetical protein [Bacteroidia bacterium]
MTIKNLPKIALTTLAFFILSGCEEESISFEEDYTASISLYANGEATNISDYCLVIDETNPANRYSRVDSIKVYGYGIDFILPDSLKESDLTLIVSGKWRETESITGNIAISIQNNTDSIMFFNTLNAKDFITSTNTWYTFTDTFYINKTQNSTIAKRLRVFSGKPNGKGFLDVDDLKINITKL